jgi:hypothetical protein
MRGPGGGRQDQEKIGQDDDASGMAFIDVACYASYESFE